MPLSTTGSYKVPFHRASCFDLSRLDNICCRYGLFLVYTLMIISFFFQMDISKPTSGVILSYLAGIPCDEEFRSNASVTLFLTQ